MKYTNPNLHAITASYPIDMTCQSGSAASGTASAARNCNVGSIVDPSTAGLCYNNGSSDQRLNAYCTPGASAPNALWSNDCSDGGAVTTDLSEECKSGTNAFANDYCSSGGVPAN